MVDRGDLVYIKAALVGDEPADIAGYEDFIRLPRIHDRSVVFGSAVLELLPDWASSRSERARPLRRCEGAVAHEAPTEGQTVSAAQMSDSMREAGMIVGRRSCGRRTVASC